MFNLLTWPADFFAFYCTVVSESPECIGLFFWRAVVSFFIQSMVYFKSCTDIFIQSTDMIVAGSSFSKSKAKR